MCEVGMGWEKIYRKGCKRCGLLFPRNLPTTFLHRDSTRRHTRLPWPRISSRYKGIQEIPYSLRVTAHSDTFKTDIGERDANYSPFLCCMKVCTLNSEDGEGSQAHGMHIGLKHCCLHGGICILITKETHENHREVILFTLLDIYYQIIKSRSKEQSGVTWCHFIHIG